MRDTHYEGYTLWGIHMLSYFSYVSENKNEIISFYDYLWVSLWQFVFHLQNVLNITDWNFNYEETQNWTWTELGMVFTLKNDIYYKP
jgi:hypothetical protein